MLPSLRQLQFLVALANELHFGKAAQKCYVTQSTLSAGLKDLEAILNVCLAERTKRSVVMTPIGRQIAQRARHLLADAKDLVDLAAANASPMSGDLHLGAIPTVGPFLLPKLLHALRRSYPSLKLYLREELTESLLEGVRGGRLDAVLMALPFETGDLMVRELFLDGYALATPRPHPLSCNSAIGAEDLQGRDVMLLEQGHCLQQHALSAFPNVAYRNIDFDATSLPTLLAMVEEGLGTTLLPQLSIDAGLAKGHAIDLIPVPDALPRTIALVCRKNSSRMDDFDHLAELIIAARQQVHQAIPPAILHAMQPGESYDT